MAKTGINGIACLYLNWDLNWEHIPNESLTLGLFAQHCLLSGNGAYTTEGIETGRIQVQSPHNKNRPCILIYKY